MAEAGSWEEGEGSWVWRKQHERRSSTGRKAVPRCWRDEVPLSSKSYISECAFQVEFCFVSVFGVYFQTGMRGVESSWDLGRAEIAAQGRVGENPG